jgi:uncharacterized protein (DUF433 family)
LVVASYTCLPSLFQSAAQSESLKCGTPPGAIDSPSRTFNPLLIAAPDKYAYSVGMNQLLQNLPIDWTECPLVEINPRKLSGVPVLKGTRMQANSIVENHRSGIPADEIAGIFELPVDSVRTLLAYAAQHDQALQR